MNELPSVLPRTLRMRSKYDLPQSTIWTTQERISLAIVHSPAYQLYWDCKQRISSVRQKSTMTLPRAGHGLSWAGLGNRCVKKAKKDPRQFRWQLPTPR